METKESEYLTWVPPGHHYSPIPNSVILQERRDSVFHMQETIFGIQIDVQRQLEFLTSIKPQLDKAPFTDDPAPGNRYYYKNPMFGHADGLTLYGMLHHLKPNEIIEIGTGFSTALMIDTNINEFYGDISISCIESFRGSISDQLRSEKSLNIVDQDLYAIDLDVFKRLKPNDILFIDSTHVSKTGSDVNYLVHQVLPVLEAGVFVHFHDIMANFDYPLEWVREGRAWNEGHLIRAFLMFNEVFEVFLFNAYIGQFHNNWLRYNLPQFLLNTGGSLWIRKVK